ncbi:AAA family ATPase [Goodfellowiella coeruleoviolacea]|uniref:AAA domain-containing protein n=1 Tax=Goodfellowiella coeruleoviolacea TaxID=334858 RepID=A0AAE3KHU8_9PSEU|nr:AAA family ATPase [Goodfellowiella coeruleoviolacea]MCP2167780.1 AAA domain-containing protein [Goodfellowiella coeruleoviolacea]
MPRLLLFNGPPACGKSTLAQHYVDDHPLALNLDVDRVRSLIGRWRDDPHAAGLLARQVALAAARAHLASGHDVVVPQFLARMTFIEQLERLAREVNASFHEFVLLDSKENALRRFAERARAAVDPAHVEAREMVERGGGFDDLSVMYDRLMTVIAARPAARIVRIEEGEVDLAYRAVLRGLG